MVVVVGVIVATPPIFFFNVTVSGSASTANGAAAANVTFVDENGVPYVANVTAGSYSINLQNGHTYTVFVVSAAGGNCTSATLNLNTLGWAQAWDASC